MTQVSLRSPIFFPALRRQIFSNYASKQAKDFKQLTKERMIAGPHTGRIYEKKRGVGFTRSHRASAKGERPSPDTMTLVNAIEDKRTSDFSAVVYVAEISNPENGEVASVYAERLQVMMQRPIMSELDREQALYKATIEGEQLVKRLV
jgi:hypothetical protein